MTEAASPPVCLKCGMTGPPPDETCSPGAPGGARDHRIGSGHALACPYPDCGRLLAACVRRPCQARRAAGYGNPAASHG